jgi:general secretion pathway protein J
MKRPSQHGFTLLELMISLAIIGFMMVVAWGTVMQTVDAKKHFEGVQDRYREVRVALARVTKDLGMAYLSKNEPIGLPPEQKLTFFVGESSMSEATLRFSTLAHENLVANASESDQTVIAYYVDSDPEDRSKKNLYRRENRRLAPEKWDAIPAEVDVLFTGLTKLQLQYWNAQDREWEDSWDTLNADGKKFLPERVKIVLGFLDERGKEVVFMTQARIHRPEVLEAIN